MTDKAKEISQKIITLLAEHVGTDKEELKNTDMFQNDIHMSAKDLADFVEKLTMADFDTSTIDLLELETVGDLVDSIVSQEELS